MERKRFNELQEGDYLFCATHLGGYCRSKVYKVKHYKKITKVWHDWYGGQQNLNGADTCKDCGGYLRYVATTKEELCLLMQNGVNDLERQMESIKILRDELSERIFTLRGLSYEEVKLKYD